MVNDADFSEILLISAYEKCIQQPRVGLGMSLFSNVQYSTNKEVGIWQRSNCFQVSMQYMVQIR
jgi:hypothetical protein